MRWLLTCHRDSEKLLRGDEVVEVLGGLVDVDLDPMHRTGELGRIGIDVVG